DFKYKDYQLGKITINGETIELPVVGVPGTPEGTFGIALGYGRTYDGSDTRAELKNGKNVFHLLSKSGDNFTNIAKADITKAEGTTKLAITQTHFNITMKDLEGTRTRKVVKETILKDYQKKKNAGNEDREEILEELTTLYPEHEKPGHHWTMVIDLNTCTGCS